MIVCRYLQPPANWVSCALESRELLAMCLKRIKGLEKVHLVDANFVWTEPHSKRVKVKLTIQKEVLGSTILEQVFVVEFTVHNQMCDDCRRQEASDYWKAVVQVRQRTNEKKTLFYVEQLILKHNAHANTLRIKEQHGGLDFYYGSKQDARRLVDFLLSVVPCRYKTSQQLISHDIRSNVYNYKHTFSVEIVPLVKDCIVCLPAATARAYGNISPVLVCIRVTTSIQLIDPRSLQMAEVSQTVFWRHPFKSLCGSKDLEEYIVLEVEPVRSTSHLTTTAHLSYKFLLAEVCVSKSSEIGLPGCQRYCRTHLGHLLKPGDSVLGFDLSNSNVNDENLAKLREDYVPDLILVKKSYGEKRKRRQKRVWTLKYLPKESGEEAGSDSMDQDYDDFLADLEEDVILRQSVNIYKDPARLKKLRKDVSAPAAEDPLDETPYISLAEMLDDLCLDEPESEPMTEL